MSDEVISGNHESQPALPPSVRQQVERALGRRISRAQLADRGIHKSTFLIAGGESRWVARVAPSPAKRLRRSTAAQQKAASAGVRVPKLVAAQLDHSRYAHCWTVEEHVDAQVSRLLDLDPASRRATAADIGRQLRLLHTIQVDGFGWLDEAAARGPARSFRQWLDSARESISEGLSLGVLPKDLAGPAERAYDLLGEVDPGRARLCHGDVHGENILVAPGRMLALLDWGNAKGCEGCHDLSIWLMWHDDLATMDAMIAGYEPQDPTVFRQRTIAHCIALACPELCDFQDEAETVADLRRALRHCAQVMEP